MYLEIGNVHMLEEWLWMCLWYYRKLGNETTGFALKRRLLSHAALPAVYQVTMAIW